MAGMGVARDYYTLQPVLSVLCQGKGHVSVVRQHATLASALSVNVLLSQKQTSSPENDFYLTRTVPETIHFNLVCQLWMA